MTRTITTAYSDSHIKQQVYDEATSSLRVTSVGGSSSATSYATRIDSATTTNVTYVGKAVIGTASSAASWQIQKLDETTTNVLIITWADGNDSFDNVWDNRASLTYS